MSEDRLVECPNCHRRFTVETTGDSKQQAEKDKIYDEIIKALADRIVALERKVGT